jgi:NOL1/NOP2/fmu family ribosome biogenesis protein
MCKRGAEPATTTPRPWRPARLARTAEAAYHAFCAAHLMTEPTDERLALVGSHLYALPVGLPDLAGLRFLHPGWWLGMIKKDRFEPSHALALALCPEDARRPVNLSSGSSELAAYLRGESFRTPEENGWVLVCVDGYPLGWGKRVDGTIKSHYPRGLRRV